MRHRLSETSCTTALFDAALETLRGLGKGTEPHDAVTTFELVWLRELGYSPRLDACAACGAELLPVGVVRAVFSPSAGGALCPACGPGAADRRWLSPDGLSALRALAATAEDDGPVPHAIPVGGRGELRLVLGQTVSFVLGRRPRLLGYLDGR